MGTITKALKLLDSFSASRPEIGLSEFVRLVGRDKATIYRHLSELEQNGFVEQDQVTRNYRLGPAVLRLANVRERTFPARDAMAPIVDAMSRDLGELIHVSFLQAGALSPVYHAEANIRGTRVFFDEAEILPLHATASGLAALAFGPPDLLDQVLACPLEAHTRQTATTAEGLRALVAQTRQRGYSTSDQGFETDVFGHAAPIFGPAGQLIGTLAIALPTGRATPDNLPRVRRSLTRNAARISHVLGGHVPPELEGKWQNAG